MSSYPGDRVLELVANQKKALAELESKWELDPHVENFLSLIKRDHQTLLDLQLQRDPVKLREENWIKSFSELADYLMRCVKSRTASPSAAIEVSEHLQKYISASVQNIPRNFSMYYLEHFRPDSEIAQIIRNVEALSPAHEVQYYDDTVYACYVGLIKRRGSPLPPPT